MKTLHLVRHAKSSWSDASLTDRERPLNKRGRRNAPEMGRRLAAKGHGPELIVSSPANRALTTARVIANELGYDEAAVVTDEALYFGSMQDVLEGLDDRYSRVMVVGHNPTMTYHLNSLANAAVDNMPTCAIAVIGFAIDSWADLYRVGGELLDYDFPKRVTKS